MASKNVGLIFRVGFWRSIEFDFYNCGKNFGFQLLLFLAEIFGLEKKKFNNADV